MTACELRTEPISPRRQFAQQTYQSVLQLRSSTLTPQPFNLIRRAALIIFDLFNAAHRKQFRPSTRVQAAVPSTACESSGRDCVDGVSSLNHRSLRSSFGSRQQSDALKVVDVGHASVCSARGLDLATGVGSPTNSGAEEAAALAHYYHVIGQTRADASAQVDRFVSTALSDVQLLYNARRIIEPR